MNSIFELLRPDVSTNIDGYYLQGNKEDCSFLKTAKIFEKDTTTYFPYQIMLMGYNESIYANIMSALSFGSEINKTNNIIETEITPGMIALFLSEIRPQVISTISQYELLESVFYPIKEVEYNGHDAQDIMKYFGVLRVFNVRSEINISIPSIMTDFLLSNPSTERAIHESGQLKIVNECAEYFSNISFAEQMSKILFVKEFENAYIRLYQLIEMLYPLPYVRSVHSKLNNISNTVIETLEIITESLEWKYIEINALEKLLREIPEANMPNINGFCELSSSNDIYVRTAKIIYSIRCKLVHLKFNQEKVTYEEEKWSILYHALLVIIKHLYSNYFKLLSEA
jgi:hypothetical protein